MPSYLLDAFTPPGPDQMLVLEFPPTHSLITDLEGFGPPEGLWWIIGTTVLVAHPAPGFAWPPTLKYVGAPLQTPHALYKPRHKSILDLPRGAGLRAWYEYRVLLSSLSGAHDFFFSLDRDSHAPLLDFRRDRGEIGHQYAKEQREHARASTVLLKDRLEDRWNGKRGKDVMLPRTKAEEDHVRACCQTFCSSSSTLRGGSAEPSRWTLVGHACAMFGSGEMAASVVVGNDPNTATSWLVAVPDSANILMFAELGLLCDCLKLEVAVWDVLLPFLVRMQLYYWARVSEPQAKLFNEYYQPTRDLSIADRLTIDKAVPIGVVTQREPLEELIFEGLRKHVSGF